VVSLEETKAPPNLVLSAFLVSLPAFLMSSSREHSALVTFSSQLSAIVALLPAFSEDDKAAPSDSLTAIFPL
jgi:hypothetical protein